MRILNISIILFDVCALPILGICRLASQHPNSLPKSASLCLWPPESASGTRITTMVNPYPGVGDCGGEIRLRCRCEPLQRTPGRALPAATLAAARADQIIPVPSHSIRIHAPPFLSQQGPTTGPLPTSVQLRRTICQPRPVVAPPFGWCSRRW